MNQEEPDEQQPLSRQAYRQQHRSKKPVDSGESTQPSDEPQVLNDVDQKTQEETDQPLGSRMGVDSADVKVQRLKKKLNIAIIGLAVAIIVVYLILFFVG